MIIVCAKCKKPFKIIPSSNLITIICQDCRKKEQKVSKK